MEGNFYMYSVWGGPLDFLGGMGGVEDFGKKFLYHPKVRKKSYLTLFCLGGGAESAHADFNFRELP